MDPYGAVKRLVTAMSILHEQHDHHGQHTAELARKLAQAAGVSGPSLEQLETGAHLHDLGKLFCDPKILRAPRKLTPEEMEVVQQHTVLGWASVDQAGYEPSICEIVRSHHERYDGNGYPDGLAGESIPLGARIVRVADCYAALISPRVYRSAYSPPFAKSYLQAGRGAEFDGHLVDLFFELVVSDG